MRLLVCGSRDFTDYEFVLAKMSELDDVTVVIHGAARGADSLGERAARELGIETLAFPADWGRYGRRAGYVRNQQMLDEGRPDFVLAFKSKPVSAGTDMMVKIATDAGVNGAVFTHR